MTAADVADLLELSDERDRWLRRVLEAEKCGFARGVASMAAEYDRGFADGCQSLKAAQHDAHRLAELDARRWSLRRDRRGRESFGQPHHDDYVAPTPRTPRPWLGGPPAHRHECSAACWAIKPGFYSPAAAADILEQLPGDYADEIARLRGAR